MSTRINKVSETRQIANAYKKEHGIYPTQKQLIKLSGFSRWTIQVAMRDIESVPEQIKYTKAQETHIESRLKILESEFDKRVLKKVEEYLSWRDTKDAEIIEQANALLLRNIGPGSKPFAANEYVNILRALHPDSTTPENRMEAFKLMNSKKLILREEGRIELRGRRIPRTPEEWKEAKMAASEARKVRS